MAVVYMTEDGYKKLADEIAQMEAVDRDGVSNDAAWRAQ